VNAVFKLGVAVSYLKRISGLPDGDIDSSYLAGYEDGKQVARKLADQGLY